jgi:hypothetical protein
MTARIIEALALAMARSMSSWTTPHAMPAGGDRRVDGRA